MYRKRVGPTNDFIEFEREEIERSMPERFQEQVVKYGDRIAVVDKDQSLTYNELNERVNRIAEAILERRGEGQEPIALLLQHGAPIVSAIIGVLKAGKIHMPLASWYPRARTDYMLRDSQAGLIVTDNENLPDACELAQGNMQLLNIDELDNSFSAENLHLPIKPDDLVWLLYTSGSTGQPKGVSRNHRDSLHSNMTATNDMHICLDDRMASLSQSETGFWYAILNGATFYYRNIREEGLAGLADWLVQEKITICTFVVTAFRHFVDTLTGDEQFPKLRLLCLVSEPVYRRDVELFKQYFPPDCLLVNQMGIAEAGTVCRYFVDKNTQIGGSFVPVGYPVSDKEVLLLDKHGEEVEANQIGEIAVKSRHLSEGYWNKPELTQARFLSVPDGGNKRVYLTGDLGRMLPDGRLVHLGRKDFQIKIRGHRVEVAEIEMAMLDLDYVKEVIIVAQADLHGDQRLIAYLAPFKGSSFTISMLRRALEEVLPEYMIPSIFVKMDSLPLTPSGKISRLDLPEPGTARPELDTPFVAPRTPVETKLAEIWADVLGLDEVGIHDNFFELGGNSLMTTQILSRVVDTFQIGMHLRSLLQSPTVSHMSLSLVQNMTEKVESENIKQMLTKLEEL